TAAARERLGAGKLLLVEQGIVLETDESRAREVAREHCAFYLRAENYRNNMVRLGFTEQDVDDASDRLVEAIVAWGDEDAIRERVRAHLDAGANHVCIQVLPSGDFHLDALRRLAPA